MNRLTAATLLGWIGLCTAAAGAGEWDLSGSTAGEIRVLRWPFAENDRARCERQEDGLVKVVATPRGKVLGASLVGPHAGELIHPWVLAISKGLGVGAMAQMIAPYPTLGEVSKRAAGSYYTAKLFGAGTRRVVRLLAKLG